MIKSSYYVNSVNPAATQLWLNSVRKRWRHGKAIVFEIKVENQTAGAAGVFKFLLFKERLKSSFFLTSY